jgi:3-methyl-2-oxobutanoate hydroxymethyltransferase
MSAVTQTTRLTIADITKLYADGKRFPMLTAYDYPTARLVDEAGVPIILVGDSLATVLLGYDSEIRVTVDQMLHHTSAVVRGTKHAVVVGDMPFLSYSTPAEAVDNAGRFLQEAGAQAVKLEGGVRSARQIEAVVKAGIPVMGHIGWTPQSKHALGGKVRVQGKTVDRARAMVADAFAVQEAGAFAIVLELVPDQLAREITKRLSIPTIGIGAGPGCSAEVQVITDLLGWSDWHPRHAKPFANLHDTILAAVREYAAEVEAGTFPGPEQTSSMDDTTLDEVFGRSRMDLADDSDVVALPLDRDL